MLFDRDYDMNLWASADRRRHCWTTEKQLWGNRERVRQAGHAPVSASAHSLLVIGIIHSLQTVSNRQVTRILDHPGRERSQRKPTLKIVTVDQTFADSLNALLKRDKELAANVPMRAARNFLAPLARQLSRFDTTVVTEVPHAFQRLRQWSRALNQVDEKATSAFQSAFPLFAVASHDFPAPL